MPSINKTAGGPLLVLSQVYVPDPAAVGQYVADAAREMAKRGIDVRVFAADTGYDDPSVRYKRREVLDNVKITRFPFSSFGKRSLVIRLFGDLLFVAQIIVSGIFMPRPARILVTAVPPMCAAAAIILGMIRRAPITYWVMDINPDLAVRMRVVRQGSPLVAIMDALNRSILKAADRVIVLDRFMEATINRKLDVSGKMAVLPPWPHEDHVEPVPHEKNPFRKKYGLGGKFVFMYSGNHGIGIPLKTFLEAAALFKDDQNTVFIFIGGGVRKREVEDTIRAYHMKNMLSLPYQPLQDLRYSLSAADVHLVAMDERLVGVAHPCKIYGAMAAGRPVLFLGPERSHIGDILREYPIGWRISHGDVQGAVEMIRSVKNLDREELAKMGQTARQAVDRMYTKQRLCGAVCDLIS